MNPAAAPAYAVARLSTAVRMLLIMTAALLPLGLIAVFASIESAQSGRLRREADALAVAAAAARQLSGTIARQALLLRTETARLARAPLNPVTCLDALDALRLARRYPVGFALFDRSGRTICRTRSFSSAPARPPDALFATEVRLEPTLHALRFETRSRANTPYGVGELPLATLAEAARPVALTGQHRMILRQGDKRLLLSAPVVDRRGGREVMVSSPVAGGQLALELTLTDLPISAVEVVMTLLPLLMWLAAAVIGWIVVNRLIIRPLYELQGAIAGHRAGAGPLVLPVLTTPATEIRALGEAFRDATVQLAQHERELEEGLARQTRLTREVHHRVKNNLQVVASLINLHARGVAEPAVAAAYASIQRRVDALAVVHRNHYAELEENRGVGLRALIGELAANLRATAPADAAHLAITLDVAPLYASQDVAAPIAFLITECVELAMACAPRDTIRISLAPAASSDRSTLAVTAAGLTAEACLRHPSRERFDRIVEGLSRQLRAKLTRDADLGRFAIEISTRD